MKRLLVCVMAMAALAVGTARAEATTLFLGDSTTVFFDGTGTACSTCDATATFTLTDASTLTIILTNTSWDGGVGENLLTALGFNSTPNLSVASYSYSVAGWSFTTGSNGVLQMEALASTTSGIKAGLDGGQSLTLVLNLTAPIDSFTLDASAVHIQATNTAAGSIKLTGGGDGGGSGGDGGGSSPEPATMLLFGLALTGAGLRMRRS